MVADASQGTQDSRVAWIDGATLGSWAEGSDPLDLAYASLIDDDYRNSVWNGVRDWDGDGLIDPEANLWPADGDADLETERLIFSATLRGEFSNVDASGGYTIGGTELESSASAPGPSCWFANEEIVTYQHSLTWVVFPTPATMPTRHSELPARRLQLEESVSAACGDVTGDGADDLVFGVQEDWMDGDQIRVIPGWSIPWDDDTYWP